jgi:membrane associated rhomboid family serine protease
MSWQQNLRYKYAMASVLEKVIGVNVLFFVVTILFGTLGFLFNVSGDFWVEWLVFPKDIVDFLWKPWSIITYAFMHSGFFHLLINMWILYFSGRFFLEYFTPKKFMTYYLLGGIVGALVFMLSYNLFPAFQGIGKSYLMGASASVMAILVGIATRMPNMQIRLFLLGNVKLWHIAVVFVFLDVVRIPLGNAGGHLAHLGGALLGYFYSTQLAKGNDIGAGFERLVDQFVGMFSSSNKKSTTKSTSRMRTVHKNKSTQTSATKTVSKTEKQKKIDAILDKISKSGYDSLSKEEKEFLFNAGKDI